MKVKLHSYKCIGFAVAPSTTSQPRMRTLVDLIKHINQLCDHAPIGLL